jgi:hypothetical protein
MHSYKIEITRSIPTVLFSDGTESLHKKKATCALTVTSVACCIYSDSTQGMKRAGMVKQGIFNVDLATRDTWSRPSNDVLLSEEMGKPRRQCTSGCYCASCASEIKH